MARVSRSRMILTACGTQQTVVKSAPVAPIASTITGGIIPRPIFAFPLRVAVESLGLESSDLQSLRLESSGLANHLLILTTARCEQHDKRPTRDNNDARLT